MGRRVRMLAALVGTAAVVALAPKGSQDDIEGTYRLVSRELPDGTQIVPPAIQGMLTYDGGYRNFNAYWTDAEGDPVSIGYIAEYELTGDTYSETNVYMAVNDGTGGGVTYDVEPQSGSSPVTREGGRISFDLPLWEEPSVVFEGDGLTATREGAFVDHWEKVE